MKNVAIIGAGFGGMSAAYDLARAGYKVHIYEASDYVGGLASGFKLPYWDWSVEKYYHHWFESDHNLLGLIEELGWSDRVTFPRPYTVMYHEGEFYPFDSIVEAIKFPGLGWGISKLRFGLVGLYLRLTGNWRALESVTVDEWMRKWAGDRVYELMWEPLMIGKFGEHYAKQVTMAWMWARLHARSTRLGTYQGGFQAFADQFADRLRGMGVRIALESPVSQINQAPEGGLIVRTQAGLLSYDQVLVTTSPALLARFAPELPPGAEPHLLTGPDTPRRMAGQAQVREGAILGREDLDVTQRNILPALLVFHPQLPGIDAGRVECPACHCPLRARAVVKDPTVGVDLGADGNGVGSVAQGCLPSPQQLMRTRHRMQTAAILSLIRGHHPGVQI